MKLSLMAAVALLFSLNTWANDNRIAVTPTIIISALQTSKSKAPEIRYGFFDSSFDYSERNGLTPNNKSMCYVGKVEDLCGIIKNVEKEIRQVYSEGAHDYLDVSSCEIKNGTDVEVKYRLVDDYGGDLNVKRLITECNR